MLPVDHDPGHVGVCWLQLVSHLAHFVLPVVALLGGSAGGDFVPADAGLPGALLTLRNPIAARRLEADDERQGLRVELILVQFDRAGFD